MKIIGMRVEKYIDKAIKGHNCNFEYYDSEFERHIIFGVLSNNKKVQITLWEEEGECGSGWGTASFGRIDVTEVKRFGGYTYTPKKTLVIDDINPNTEEEDITNNVFSVSYDGGDSYYPSGSYSVNMDLFIEGTRTKECRPVWLFTGEPNADKGFISSHLDGLTVYETDSYSVLPDIIIEDVIVLGDKNNYKIEDIKKKIFGTYELNIVEFELDVVKKDSRRVWIFFGDSNTGKSFISSRLKGLSVYETDSSDLLPDIITEDIIVLGNKYNFSFNNVKSRIAGDYALLVAEFVQY